MIFTASASITSTSPGDLAVPVSVTGGGQPNTWSLAGFLERRAFAGISAWLNTPGSRPLSLSALRGKGGPRRLPDLELAEK
jgi:hypothetical protein